MKKYYVIALLVGATLLSLVGCSKTEELSSNSSIVDTNTPLNDFDYWLEKYYLSEYNIQFAYRYSDILVDMDTTLTPADYEESILLAKLTLHLVMGAYDEHTGSADFMKTYFPKLIQLVGSPSYNDDGSVVLGEAEGGKAIFLYDVNTLSGVYNQNSVAALNDSYFHTMHHEFAHILHQTKPYSTEYESYSSSLYVGSDCFATYTTDAAALQVGFVTRYSATNADEDFVEILSTYITNTESYWESLMAVAETVGDDGVKAGGRVILEQKLDIIRSYLLSSWGIEMDELRDIILRRQTEVWDFDYSLSLE
ncbi:MAG: putative zinc-binding metallopeptidase [Rikenellaceae bacterium]